MKFRSDIEGLRAIAVLPVLAYHLSSQVMPGGFVGVDVFFVISGYLISGLLLQRIDAGSYSIADFYAARVRRIFPALFVMLFACGLVGAVALPPGDYAELGSTIASTALFYSNYEFNRLSDYFGGAAELKPLLHTWSLAVEEQFYILFPLVLLVMRRHGARWRTVALVVLALLSAAYSVRTTASYPTLAFYSALTRAFELLCGAILATCRAVPPARPIGEAAAAAGLLAIVASLAFYSNATPFPGWQALIPAGGTALLLWAGHGGATTVVGRAIANPPFRWFGRISYSLYLWHWPVIVFFKYFALRPPEGFELAACAVAAIALATASYRWVETPCRMAVLARRPLLWLGAGLIAVTSALGLTIASSGGLPGRFDPASLAYFQATHDRSPVRRRCHADEDERLSYADRCRFGPPTSLPKGTIVVWGDSHGGEFAHALGEAAKGHGITVVQITSSSCPPSIGFNPKGRPNCAARNAETLREITADPRVGSIVLATYYDHYLAQDRDRYAQGFQQLVGALAGSDKRLIVLAPFPRFDMPVPMALGMLQFRGADPIEHGLSANRLAVQRHAALALIEGSHRQYDFRVFDPATVLCSLSMCPAAQGQRALYFDEHHVTTFGAALVAEGLLQQMTKDPA